MIKREKPPYVGYLALPGGKIEFAEHPSQAIKREVFEETGVRIKDLELKAVVSEVFEPNGTDKMHFLLFVFQGTANGDEKLYNTQEGRVNWLAVDKIEDSESLIIPSDYLLLTEILAGNGFGYKELQMTQSGEKLKMEHLV